MSKLTFKGYGFACRFYELRVLRTMRGAGGRGHRHLTFLPWNLLVVGEEIRCVFAMPGLCHRRSSICHKKRASRSSSEEWLAVASCVLRLPYFLFRCTTTTTPTRPMPSSITVPG